MLSEWHARQVISAGASGAIFGVFGMLLAYVLIQRGSVPRGIVRSLTKSTVLFIIYNLSFGLAVSGIDNSAHLGGLLGGVLIGLVTARPLDVPRRRRQYIPRTAAGLVVSIIILTIGWRMLPKANYDLPAQRALLAFNVNFYAHDKALFDQYDTMAAMVDAGKAPMSGIANLLKVAIAPGYASLERQAKSYKLSPHSPLKPLQTAIISMCDAWMEYSKAQNLAAASNPLLRSTLITPYKNKLDAAMRQYNTASGEAAVWGLYLSRRMVMWGHRS
jgi:rhomboid protease GluP